jgi:hypothetical protein
MQNSNFNFKTNKGRFNCLVGVRIEFTNSLLNYLNEFLGNKLHFGYFEGNLMYFVLEN